MSVVCKVRALSSKTQTQQEHVVVGTLLANSNIQISAIELKHLLDSQADVCILDVRQPEEHQLVAIDQSVLFPLDELAERIEELKQLVAEKEVVVVYCHHGMRSAMAVEWLLVHGFSNLKNLTGGINAYATEVDCSLQAY